MGVEQYSLVAHDWLNLEFIINDLASRVIGQELAPGSSPTFAGLTIVNTIDEFSTDGTMAGNSDSAVPTEKATKLYTDTLRSDLASVANAKGASLVGVEDSASLYTAANVETALAEVMDKVTPVTTTGNSITTPTGTVDAGDIDSTTTIDDADSYDVSEVTGSPGFDIQITFTGIVSGKEPNKVQLHIGYDGSAGHNVDLEMWNYTGTPQWDVISADFLPDTGGVFAFYEIDIPGTVTDYVSGGEAKLRFNHTSAGNANHNVFIDFAALKHDLGSGAGVTEHGALSGLGDDDHLQYIKDSEFTQDSGVLVGTGAGTFAEETGNTLRTSIGLGTGDSPTWTGATLYSSAPMLRLRDTGATADATNAFVEFGGTDAGVWSRTGWVGDGSSGDTTISLWAEVGNLQLGDSSGIDVLTLSGGNAVFTGTVTGTSFITAGNIGVVADADLLQLAANTLTVNGTITLPLANKINFRDSDISISSPFDGTLDIGADISVDFFYDNADVGDAVDGQSVYINRRAAEGDDYIRLYIDKDRKGLIGFNGVDDLLQLATTGLTVNGKLRVEGADANQKIAEFVGDDASHNRICICGPIDADSQLSFMHGGSPVWSIGNNADNDAFIIRTGTGAFGTNDKFAILSTGALIGKSTAAFEGASATVGKASTTTGTLVLHDSNSANTITLTVPDITAGSLTFTLPPTDGDNLDVLQTNGSGVLTWVAAAGGATDEIVDADNDTKVQVEKSSDEDIIRFDTAGNERMSIDAVGIITYNLQSGAGVAKTVAQTVVTATWTRVQFETEDYDNQNEYDNVTEYRFTATVGGLYLVSAFVNINEVFDGSLVHLAVRKNGTRIAQVPPTHGSATNPGGNSITVVVKCVATDFLEIWVYHTVGVNKNIAGNGESYVSYTKVA